MAVEDAYELAYREAVRALEHQRAAATELQSRAGMLLATASIAVSLLDRDSFGAMRPLGWLAVLCFVLLSLCVLAVVWPHADGTFSADPQALLAGHLASGLRTSSPSARTSSPASRHTTERTCDGLPGCLERFASAHAFLQFRWC